MSSCQNPTITDNDSSSIKSSINKYCGLIRTLGNTCRRTADYSLLRMGNQTHDE